MATLPITILNIIVGLKKIRTIVKQHPVIRQGLARAELIRLVQREEGGIGCYATARLGQCDQLACIWRQECFSESGRLEMNT